MQARHQLRYGQVTTVIDEIAQARQNMELHPDTRQALTRLHTYLDNHRDHMDYQQLKTMTLPIGSGLVESACKWLIQQRFKGVGMRWSEEGFDALLYLRVAWVNGRFEELFPLDSHSPKL